MVLKAAYPQPDLARSEWITLNGTWEFSFDVPEYDRKIEVPYAWGSPLSGIEEQGRTVGYYRRFVRWAPNGERIFLIFGAVDYLCEVRVNDVLVGSHRGGYDRFEFDVTDLWSRGEENEITLRVEDQAGRDQLYGKQGYGAACGIWQTVWLETRPAAYIQSFFVQTKLDGTVSYDVELAGAADGSILSSDFEAIHAEAVVENGAAKLVFHVAEPRLWTPETPYLYEGTIRLGEDVVSTYFGIREIGSGLFGANGRRYLTLNGKPYYLNGVLDQSFNKHGFFTLPADTDCRDEILRMKKLGLNLARIHVKAEEPLKLYYADKLGLLLMEDIPCFWGEASPETRNQYEREMEAQLRRDRNHPSIIQWVLFNETWGLFTGTRDAEGNVQLDYRADTVKWVVQCYHRAKQLDPTRLIEDNSPVHGDHAVTDVNTWHFYANGYGNVRDAVDTFCRGAYPGSGENYVCGYTMADVPCMNSECGNVWGIDGNAGESDISWQYKYMLNEFRRQDKLCGFVFTEFHDVVNEFNGYYKLDNSEKDFGYEEYGVSLQDLHAQDYLGADFAPMTTLTPNAAITVPMFGSSFTDLRHGQTLRVCWQLLLIDPVYGNRIAESGEYALTWGGYGTFPAGSIALTMPEHDGTAVLRWSLMQGDSVILRNCIFFDIDAGMRKDVLALEPAVLRPEGWTHSFLAQEGNKCNGLGSGSFCTEVFTEQIPGLQEAEHLSLLFEASSRAPMSHDFPDGSAPDAMDLDYMMGYSCDPGANRNSFPQTDMQVHPGDVEVLVDGVWIGVCALPDCPADFRGALSHHYQKTDRLLDEAGSYGYLCRVEFPAALLMKLKRKKSFILTLRTTSGAGLSLYGRRSGRYGMGLVLQARK